MVTRESGKAMTGMKKLVRGAAESSEGEEEGLNAENNEGEASGGRGRGCDSGLGMAALATTSMEESEEEEELHGNLNHLMDRLEKDMEDLAKVPEMNEEATAKLERRAEEWNECKAAVEQWAGEMENLDLPKRNRATRELRKYIGAMKAGAGAAREAMQRHNQFVQTAIEEIKQTWSRERRHQVEDMRHTVGMMIEARVTLAALRAEPERMKQLSESGREGGSGGNRHKAEGDQQEEEIEKGEDRSQRNMDEEESEDDD